MASRCSLPSIKPIYIQPEALNSRCSAAAQKTSYLNDIRLELSSVGDSFHAMLTIPKQSIHCPTEFSVRSVCQLWEMELYDTSADWHLEATLSSQARVSCVQLDFTFKDEHRSEQVGVLSFDASTCKIDAEKTLSPALAQQIIHFRGDIDITTREFSVEAELFLEPWHERMDFAVYVGKEMIGTTQKEDEGVTLLDFSWPRERHCTRKHPVILRFTIGKDYVGALALGYWDDEGNLEQFIPVNS